MNRNGRPILASVLLVVAIGCFSGMALLQHRANREQAALAAAYQTCTTSYQAATTQLTQAKSKHLAEYWQTVDFGPVDRDRALVEQTLKPSHANPSRRLKQLNEANRALGRATRGLNHIVAYLDELDEAQAKMATAPGVTTQRIKLGHDHINGLVVRGYFERCFAASRHQLVQAKEQQSEGVLRAAHYLEAYRLCQQADTLTEQAVQTADAVLTLQKQNEQMLADIVERRRAGLNYLPTVRQAAASLEYYPPYRCLAQLDRQAELVRLGSFDQLLAAAKSNNSMAAQWFDQARDQLATVNETLTALEQLSAKAIEDATTVEQARQSLPTVRSNASSEIARAEQHIRSNSQNSQFSARSDLDEARSSLAQGDHQTAVDPPDSLRLYQQAERQASNAYSAVDTSTESSSSGSSSGGSSSGSSFGGSSGGGSSGGSSSGSSGGSFGGSSSGSYGGSSSGSHGSGF